MTAPLSQAARARLQRERQVVETMFPEDTRLARDGDEIGWVYRVTNDLHREYTMFAYYLPKAGIYMVKVIAPRPRGVDPHAAHVFEDGVLCLSPDIGCPTLAQAYAKGVLWTIGFQVFEATGIFGLPGA